ncbi:hypothetical protein Trydic_g17618 [Trypoxylus dichotomus]
MSSERHVVIVTVCRNIVSCIWQVRHANRWFWKQKCQFSSNRPRHRHGNELVRRHRKFLRRLSQVDDKNQGAKNASTTYISVDETVKIMAQIVQREKTIDHWNLQI